MAELLSDVCCPDMAGSTEPESDAVPDICCMAEKISNIWESASGSAVFPFSLKGMASGGSICRIVCIFSIIFMDCFIFLLLVAKWHGTVKKCIQSVYRD